MTGERCFRRSLSRPQLKTRGGSYEVSDAPCIGKYDCACFDPFCQPSARADSDGAECSRSDHRGGRARYRRRCLPLFLSAHLGGHHAEAIHEHRGGKGIRQRSDEYVRERSGVSACRFESGRADQLRYALFHCMARSHQGTADRLRAGHGRAILPPADARHVDGCFRFAGLADDRHPGGEFPRHAARLERNGSGRIYAHQRADSLCLDHRPHQDGRPGRLRCGA